MAPDGQIKEDHLIEYIKRDMRDGTFFTDIHVDGRPYVVLGPYDTETERQKELFILLTELRRLGAVDLPLEKQ